MTDSQVPQGSPGPSATTRMPRLGPAIAAGSRVAIRVSKGASAAPGGYVTIPGVLGLPQGDALGQLQALGLPAEVLDDHSDAVARGHVIGQLPHAGQSVTTGTQSVLLVSSGPAANPAGQTALPIVAGLSEQEAVAALSSAGLVPLVVHEFSPNVPQGIVIDQLPSAASIGEVPEKKRSLLWLWIALGALLLIAVGAFAVMAMNRTVAVPNVVGMSEAEAQAAIVGEGLKVGTVDTTQTVDAAEVGKVVAEDPPPAAQVRPGSPINIVVSGGQRLVAVPAVTGQPQASAQAALAAAGLTFKVTNGASAVVPKGSVISQAPSAGQQVPTGTSIGLTVSTGPGNATVPSVVGQTQSEAQAALKALGLGSKVVSEYNAATKGDVFGQSPAAGTLVAPGAVVTIQISNGPQPAPTQVTVPKVIGYSESDATSMLKNAGFKVQVSQVETFTIVSAQTPAGDTKAAKGSTVKIVIGSN
jgi:beta-lactam-binding protein with PASTA domain